MIDWIIDQLLGPIGIPVLFVLGVAGVLVGRARLRRRRRQSWHEHLVLGNDFQPLTDRDLRRELETHVGEVFKPRRRRPKLRIEHAFVATRDALTVIVADVSMVGELHVPVQERHKTVVQVSGLPVTLPAIESRPMASIADAVAVARRARDNPFGAEATDTHLSATADPEADDVMREQLQQWSGPFGPMIAVGRDHWLLVTPARRRLHPREIRGLLAELFMLIERLTGRRKSQA